MFKVNLERYSKRLLQDCFKVFELTPNNSLVVELGYVFRSKISIKS